MRSFALVCVLLSACLSGFWCWALAEAPVTKRFVPEPAGYWQGPMHSMTPETVAGGRVADAQAVAKLKQDATPVLIDVANLERKPGGVPSLLPWSPQHLSIPGATWMPGAGSGRTDAAFEAAFARRLADLTGGDKDKPVVTFCHPQRWGSYNAAKRAAALGYRHVYWMKSGAEGWREAHDATVVQPDPAWKASFAKLGSEPIEASQKSGK